MKTFLYKTFLFITISITLLLIVTFFIEALVKSHSNFKLNSKINTIILGHSHPQYAYNDSIISNTINLSYSMDSYFHSYIKLSNFIKQNPQIKSILIEFSNNSIVELMNGAIYSNNTKPKTIKYMPFMNFNEHILLFKKNPLLYLVSKIESSLIYSKKYFNNEMNVSRDFGRFEKNSKQLKIQIVKTTSSPKPRIQKTFSYLNLYYLKKIYKLTQKHHINLYLIRSPTHKKWCGRENEFYFLKLKNIYFRQIKLLDFKNFTLSNNELGDLQHLNFNGANNYSKFIDKYLKIKKIK